jgi:hypothetical protein
MTQEELQERLKKLLQEFASLVSDLENGKAEPINPSVSDEVADKIAKKICLYCGKPLIEKPKPVRGVHQSCYHQIRRSSQSLSKHVQLGLLAHESSGGRPSTFVDKASEMISHKQIDADLASAKKVKSSKKSSKKSR